MTRHPRVDIHASKKWDPSSIFESVSQWKEEFRSLETFLDEIDDPDYTTIDTPRTLASALKEYDIASRRIGRLWAYAQLQAWTDTTDSAASTRLENIHYMLQRRETISNALEQRIRSFDKVELLDEPELEAYHHFLEDVFRRERYTVDDNVQGAIDILRPILDAPDGVFQTFINRDYETPALETPDGGQVTVTSSNRDRLLRHPDREFRQSVYEAYQEAFDVAHNLLADSFATKVERNVRFAELQGYDSAREAALDEEPVNDVAQKFPVDAHSEMLNTVRERLDPYHRYYEAKRAHLDVQTLRPWDRYVSLVDGDGPEIPYEQACEYIVEAVAPLGDTYQSLLRSFLDERRVDVYETPNKTSEGLAGTLGGYDFEPYILLNYQADLRSVFIFAHELGHAMHFLLATENQPRIYSGFPYAISELPSNLHEVLLANHLANDDDSAVRSHSIDTVLRRFEDMFYRHVLLASFTQEAHEYVVDGNPLTTAWLDDTFSELLAEFQAPLEPVESTDRTWVGDNQAHRPSGSYQYVMGRAGAHAIADKIESGEVSPETYRAFLQAGSSKYPQGLLDDVNLDMTSPEPYEHALSGFAERLKILT